jgi:[ribosomal protein S5]-alanine N-acetyltransferase
MSKMDMDPGPDMTTGTAATEIRTARLRLRSARPEDLPELHAILGDARAMRYWSSLPHASLAETRDWLDGMIAAPPGESCDFVIEHDGRVIGKAGCFRLPEIGFLLHPDFWGKGFAREAVAAVIAHAFRHFPIPSLIADVDPRNAASLGLLGRLGFVETGRAEHTYRIGEEWCDSIYLTLFRTVID